MEESNLLELAKNYSILYVEDDADVLSSLEAVLRRMFANVYTATNGKLGLEAFNAHNPDIILADITMPIMDGLEMSKIIRIKNETIPIIITTAHSDESYFINSFEVGITRYIVKPINIMKLKTALMSGIELLETKRMAKRYEEKLLQEKINLESKKLTDSILNLYPYPTIALQNNKAIFINNAFMELYGSANSVICDEDNFSSIFDKNKNYISSFSEYKEGENNLVSITNLKKSRNIFLLKRQAVNLAGKEVLFFTFSDVTMLEYQRIKNKSRLQTIVNLIAPSIEKDKKPTNTNPVKQPQSDSVIELIDDMLISLETYLNNFYVTASVSKDDTVALNNKLRTVSNYSFANSETSIQLTDTIAENIDKLTREFQDYSILFEAMVESLKNWKEASIEGSDTSYTEESFFSTMNYINAFIVDRVTKH